ncbi:MAG: hypothetical protein QOF96_2623 [Actinomycetota bacterium]|nr:hypothetical protein [Actinomycetota bacterium]
MDETRRGSLPVGHWGWVYDYDDDHGGGFSSGEFVLWDDGLLQRRSVISRYRDVHTTYRAYPWTSVSWWEGETDPEAAVRLLKGHGYGLCQPNVPIDQDGATIAGPAPLAVYL